MILMIDNYDSFTYNLVQYLEELGAKIKVVKNDEIDVDDISLLNPQAIIISPGPSGPEQAGISVACIKKYHQNIPILGVCLGHQSIAYAFGGEVVVNEILMHGKTSLIYHDGKSIYEKLSEPFEATRYHSLVVREENLPDCLEITSRSQSGEIMGLRHKKYKVEGVQFHPESIMTLEGKKLLGNFLTAVS